MLKNKKIFSVLILTIMIFTIVPASGKLIMGQNDEINTEEETIEWKSYSCCIIRGEHYGELYPQNRIGFALIIKIFPRSNTIELIKGNETISIRALRGFGFFGYIQYYSIPRMPAMIFGFVIFCYYRE